MPETRSSCALRSASEPLVFNVYAFPPYALSLQHVRRVVHIQLTVLLYVSIGVVRAVEHLRHVPAFVPGVHQELRPPVLTEETLEVWERLVDLDDHAPGRLAAAWTRPATVLEAMGCIGVPWACGRMHAGTRGPCMLLSNARTPCGVARAPCSDEEGMDRRR